MESLPSIPGVKLSDQASKPYKSILQNILGVSKFPGAQPVSFSKHHLEELKSEDYFVSEKSDGIRVLLLATFNSILKQPTTLLIDRKNDYYEIPMMWFPFDVNLKKMHVNTLLDGELILDIQDGKEKLRYYAFDCVIRNGESMIKKSYHKRYGSLEYNILNPYFELISKDENYTRKHPFKLHKKIMEKSYHVDNIFQRMKRLQHKSDGLIFTSAVAPYELQTCHKQLKWKPSHENSVDFQVKVQNVTYGLPKYVLWIWEGESRYSRVQELHIDDELNQEWIKNSPNNKLIECRYGNWRFMRYRDDKEHANHKSTFEKIMESIRDNVSSEQILEIKHVIQTNWQKREQNLKRKMDSSHEESVAKIPKPDSSI